MATMSPLPSVDGLNIKESLVTADINLISEGTLALACMTRVHLYAPFLFASLWMTTHTLEQQIENSVIVVESIIRRRFIQTASLFLRLSAKMYTVGLFI